MVGETMRHTLVTTNKAGMGGRICTKYEKKFATQPTTSLSVDYTAFL